MLQLQFLDLNIIATIERNYTHNSTPEACRSLQLVQACCVIEVSLPPLIIFNWRRWRNHHPQKPERNYAMAYGYPNKLAWFPRGFLWNLFWQHAIRVPLFPINLRSLSGKPVAKTPPAISLEEKRQTWRYNGIQRTYWIHAEKHLGFNIIFSQQRWDGMGS